MSEPAEGVSAPADVKYLKLDAIASIGSAVALLIFTLITVAHLRVRAETGANVLILVTAIAAAGVVLVTFVFTTLIHEPASIVALVVILGLSIALDYWWKRARTAGAKHVQIAPSPMEQG
jgi:hypothetical protein